MKGKLPVVHMAHSVGTFFGMLGLVTDVQGKHIAFVGDRGNGRYRVPFVPPCKCMEWMLEPFHVGLELQLLHLDIICSFAVT